MTSSGSQITGADQSNEYVQGLRHEIQGLRGDVQAINDNWKKKAIAGFLTAGIGFAYANYAWQKGAEGVGHFSAEITREVTKLATGTPTFYLSTTKSLVSSSTATILTLGVVTAGTAAFSLNRLYHRYRSTRTPTTITPNLVQLVQETLQNQRLAQPAQAPVTTTQTVTADDQAAIVADGQGVVADGQADQAAVIDQTIVTEGQAPVINQAAVEEGQAPVIDQPAAPKRGRARKQAEAPKVIVDSPRTLRTRKKIVVEEPPKLNTCGKARTTRTARKITTKTRSVW
jgi:hypothetical protein